MLPLFALANAGVRLDAETLSAAVRSPLTWGIVAGLVVGKLIGITGATGDHAATGMGQLAPGLTLRRIAGGAALSGIGFTISLFIVDLAIDDPVRQDEARVGVLVASLLAFLLGWAIFRITDWLSPPEPVGLKLVRPVDPDRDHIRGDPRRAADARRVRRLRVPVLQSRDRCRSTRCARTSATSCATCGDTCRWSGCTRARSTPPGPPRPPRCRAGSSRWRASCSPTRTIWSGRTCTATPWPIGVDIERFDQDVRVHSSKVLHRVQDDAQDAEVMDLNSTPTFFVNGKRHKGPWDAASLIRALEAGR